LPEECEPGAGRSARRRTPREAACCRSRSWRSPVSVEGGVCRAD
jgi:hypothetical protein